MINYVLLGIQVLVTVIVGVFFYTQLKQMKKAQPQLRRESNREYDSLNKLRNIHLAEPLSERVRPNTFSEIIGQEEGIKSLKAILCGANPQHVLIYGPPGIGKTCAARLVLEAAKKSKGTPFLSNAKFIEMDATCVRFDERAIADPLIGSVHDPIYQGAGPLGVQGVPQPKAGAVTKAHGGVLFLDEIGELHPIQMNKLLKVLEDRKVMFESAYYNADDAGIPRHIHDIFKKGMPADFRLVGATTRSPRDISPALRSRCMEIYFRALEPDEIAEIAKNAAERAGYKMDAKEAAMVGQYAACGRDAVNIVQMCAGLSQLEERKAITRTDVEWVVESGRYQRRPDQQVPTENRVGAIHGLAVFGQSQGAVMEIEATAGPGTGHVTVTGIVEEEETGHEGHRMRRKSTVKASCENVATVLKNMGYLDNETDVHINFPGGTPVDGPSAGVAMAAVALSAITGCAIDGRAAVTGEISVLGQVKPVGGVKDKVHAAKRAGLQTVLVPRENDLEQFKQAGIEVIIIDSLADAVKRLLRPEGESKIPSVHIAATLKTEPAAAFGHEKPGTAYRAELAK